MSITGNNVMRLYVQYQAALLKFAIQINTQSYIKQTLNLFLFM